MGKYVQNLTNYIFLLLKTQISFSYKVGVIINNINNDTDVSI